LIFKLLLVAGGSKRDKDGSYMKTDIERREECADGMGCEFRKVSSDQQQQVDELLESRRTAGLHNGKPRCHTVYGHPSIQGIRDNTVRKADPVP